MEMTVKKRGLYKCSDALLSTSRDESAKLNKGKGDSADQEIKNDDLIMLDVNMMKSGKYQPHKDMSS